MLKLNGPSRFGSACARWRNSIAVAVLISMVGMMGCTGETGGAGGKGTLQRVRHAGVLRVGTDATYPPFESVDPKSGRLFGFDIELIQALAAELPARVEFVVVPFDGIVPGLRSSKYDLIISAMTITPERAKQVLFTKPYAVAGQSLVVRTADTSIQTTDQLVGKRVGCQLGTTGEMEAKKIPQAEVVSFDAIGAAFRDLQNGQLEAVIADTPTANIFIRDHPDLRLGGEPLTREEYGMAVRPQDRDLAAAMDAALEKLRNDGTLSSLEERWGLAPAGSSQ